MLDEDARFMRQALDLAGRARARGEIPVGAVLTQDDTVVGSGQNRSIELSDPTAHAEILALRDAAARAGNYRLVGSTLYCTVEPCLMCLGALMHARVGRLVFGAADPKVGAVARLEAMRSAGADFNHRFEIRGGVLGEEAADLILDFFRERRPGPSESEDSRRESEVGG